MSEIIAENTETAQVDETATEAAEKMIPQSQFNAVLQDRLAKKDAQHKAELAKIRQESLTEGQKLAKMSADERAKHDFEEKVKELTAWEQKLTKDDLKAQAKSVLIEKAMPIELAEYLPFTDAESSMKMLEVIEKGFRAAVEQGVTERLKGNPPKIGQATPAMSARDKLISEYNKAEEKADVVKMSVLDAQIKALKKE